MFVPGKEVHVHGLKLFLDMGVGIGGDKWPAADLFCQFILDDHWKEFFTKLFRDKRIIELGSGNGMAGLLVDKMYQPSEIVITDLQSHVDHIQHNISLNTVSRSVAVTFDWMNPPKDIGKFDIILAFECVYNQSLYAPLIQSLEDCCYDHSVIFLGLTRLFAKPNFFKMLSEAGFSYNMVPQESAPPEYRNESSGRDVGLFVVKRSVQ